MLGRNSKMKFIYLIKIRRVTRDSITKSWTIFKQTNLNHVLQSSEINTLKSLPCRRKTEKSSNLKAKKSKVLGLFDYLSLVPAS